MSPSQAAIAMETDAPSRASHSRAASGKSDPMSPICSVVPHIQTISIMGGPRAIRSHSTSGSTHLPARLHTHHNSADVKMAQTNGIAINNGHPLEPLCRAR